MSESDIQIREWLRSKIIEPEIAAQDTRKEE